MLFQSRTIKYFWLTAVLMSRAGVYNYKCLAVEFRIANTSFLLACKSLVQAERGQRQSICL